MRNIQRVDSAFALVRGLMKRNRWKGFDGGRKETLSVWYFEWKLWKKHREIFGEKYNVFRDRLLWKSSSVRFIDKASRVECAHIARTFKVGFHETGREWWKLRTKENLFTTLPRFYAIASSLPDSIKSHIINIIAISNRIKRNKPILTFRTSTLGVAAFN